MVSSDYIKKKALEVGFSACGIASCRELSLQKVFFDKWICEGFHSNLAYMEKYHNIRFDPSALFPGAKSVIVCAVNYKNNTIFDTPHTDNPKVASYAYTTDYHLSIKQMLRELMDALKERYDGLDARACVDSAPMLEKAWAVEAGLGWVGKNSLVISPEFGSFIVLGELLINMPADHYDEPYEEDGCGDCRLCRDACPNGAIVADRVVNAAKCIACLTIEKNANTDPELLHGWVFGCDLCLMACPHNHRTPLASNPKFLPLYDAKQFSLEFWLSLDREQFDKMFKYTPLSRAGFDAIISKIA